MKVLAKEGRSFKAFLKEKYAIALDNCNLFTKNVKHGTEHDIDTT